MRRSAYLLLGLLMTGLGILGAFLPVMPSTCFFIFAAYFLGQSSERLERWILQHPQFGPLVVSWQEHRAIPRSGKVAACMGMALGEILVVVSGAPWFVIVVATLVMILSAAYVLTRPTLQTNSRLERRLP